MSLKSTNRFWYKVVRSTTNFYGDTPCWEWIASKINNGYGVFRLNRKSQLAHRVSYELIKGKIPTGLQIDHLCRNRSCVNPEHLEAVTQKENLKRGLSSFVCGLRNRVKTHCPQGHEYNEENTNISSKGWRNCKNCIRIRSREWRQRKKLEILN